MPKYWGKQIFSHGSFPKVGQKEKTEKKRERLNDDTNNNGQLCITNATSCGAHKAAWANVNYATQNSIQEQFRFDVIPHLMSKTAEFSHGVCIHYTATNVGKTLEKKRKNLRKLPNN